MTENFDIPLILSAAIHDSNFDLPVILNLPFFSFEITSQTVNQPVTYDFGPMTLKVAPSLKGRPTVLDRDILIYAVSQFRKSDYKRPIPQTITIETASLCNKLSLFGEEPSLLNDALRLVHATFNLVMGHSGNVHSTTFSILDSCEFACDPDDEIFPEQIRISFSELILNAINKEASITVPSSYFSKTLPAERLLDEVLVKCSCIKKPWTVDLLYTAKVNHLPAEEISTFIEYAELVSKRHESIFELKQAGDTLNLIAF